MGIDSIYQTKPTQHGPNQTKPKTTAHSGHPVSIHTAANAGHTKAPKVSNDHFVANSAKEYYSQMKKQANKNFMADKNSGRLEYKPETKFFGKKLPAQYEYTTDKKQTFGDISRRFNVPLEYFKKEYPGWNGGGDYNIIDAPDKVHIDAEVLKKSLK